MRPNNRVRISDQLSNPCLFSACFFEYELPEREHITELQMSDQLIEKVNQPSLAKRVRCVEGRLQCFAFATAFLERGAVTKQIYQPDVNHRQINFDSYYQDGATVEGKHSGSLIESMVFPCETSSFSGGNLMSLVCYDVAETDSEVFLPLRSPTSLTGLVDENGACFHGAGTIDFLDSKELTLKTFERLLLLFGLKRCSKFSDMCEVHAEEIASFFSSVCAKPLKTVMDLKAFITHHGLGWLYEVDEKPFTVQVEIFFGLIRCLVPFRVAAYDGRHRMYLCAHFVTGQFNPRAKLFPSNEAPMKFEECYKRVDPKTGKKRDAKYEDCAVFQTQGLCIAQKRGGDGSSLEEVAEALRNAGYVSASQQNKTVALTYDYFVASSMDAFLQNCEEVEAVSPTNAEVPQTKARRGRGRYGPKRCIITPSGKKLLPFDRDNYWQKGTKTERASFVVDNNYTYVAQSLVRWIEVNGDVAIPTAMGECNSEWFETREIVLENKDWLHVGGYAAKFKSTQGLSKGLGAYIAAIKLLCQSSQNLGLLRTFMRSDTFEKEQNSKLDLSYYRSLDFFVRVMECSATAANHVSNRYLLEKFQWSWAVKEKNNSVLAEDLTEDKLTFKHCKAAGYFNDALKKMKQNDISDSNMSLGTATVTSKLKYAYHATLLKDIIVTVLRYGFDPKLALKGDNNHFLHLYLQ